VRKGFVKLWNELKASVADRCLFFAFRLYCNEADKLTVAVCLEKIFSRTFGQRMQELADAAKK
jgi:hypothetical protein